MVLADSCRVSRVQQYLGKSPGERRISPTGLSPSTVRLSRRLRLPCATPRGLSHSPSKLPTTPGQQRLRPCTSTGFRLLPVRSPLLGESLVYFLFLGLLRWFSSPGALPRPYEHLSVPLQIGTTGYYPRQVAPFGYLRINAR